MVASIVSRVTGVGLAIFGASALVWWLAAAATGAKAYESFLDHDDNWYGIVLGVGLSWALIQHTLTGLRHFVMDIGAGFELSRNKFWANMTLLGGVVLTALLWFYLLWVK